MRKKSTTPPTSSGGPVRFTISTGDTFTSVDENITTAATGDIVRPNCDATAASTPRWVAPMGSVFATDGSTASQKLTHGAMPDPDSTAIAHGNTSVASFPQNPCPDTTPTSDLIIPTAVMPAMKQRPVMISEMMFAYALPMPSKKVRACAEISFRLMRKAMMVQRIIAWEIGNPSGYRFDR